MDIAHCVKEAISPSHNLISVIEAGLVEEFVKTSRIISIIEHHDVRQGISLQALLIHQTKRVPVQNSSNLLLEWALPLEVGFKCDIDTPNSGSLAEVFVNISSGKLRLFLEFPFGQKTNAFVAEMLRAIEVIGKKKGPPPQFNWLQPYIDKSCGKLDLSDMNQDVKGVNLELETKNNLVVKSPDMSVNRHNIAMGLSPTPITARESHIKHQMALKEDQYMDIHKYSMFVGTWNVNGQYPSIGLAEWLSSDESPPDIYAIAFQELDLNKEAFLFNVTPREQDWLNAVLNGVHPKAHYKKVRLVRLVGMMLIVLVQEKHFAYVRNVAVDTVGTGIMNKLGNKGAVSVRLDLNSTSICFVNAHMAAHLEEFERRNEDHDCIFLRTLYQININGPPKTIRDHDHIFFFGDMNYRVNPGDYDIAKLASSYQFKPLLQNDQLNVQRRIKRIFHDFNEAEITFKPTYKYELNSDDWYSGDKVRSPAWCDRVLWCGDGIKHLQYRYHPSLNISDHKPVSAIFEVDIKVRDSRRYSKIYEEVMKKLDRLENEFLPQVSVDTTELILEPVKFLQSQTKYLTIANTGQVPVQFKFIKKLNDQEFCKPWLNIRPYTNFIMPGDKCDVALEVLVDKKTASNLNCGVEKLYDILVLHLEGGKDIFITITGDYERSCFGASINALVNVKGAFKDLTVSQIIDLESVNPKGLVDMPFAVPKELWYLVDCLHSKSLKTEGLFTTSGLMKEIAEIRNSLDSGVPNDILPGGSHSVADALLLFLEALPEPVIPFELFQVALDSTPNLALCQNVISSLPDHHRNVFVYLTAFLKEILSHVEDNHCDAKTLALVFGTVLLREQEKNPSKRAVIINSADERKKQTFVHHFLINDVS